MTASERAAITQLVTDAWQIDRARQVLEAQAIQERLSCA